MAISRRFGLRAVAIAVTFVVGACADDKGKTNEDRDAGPTMDAMTSEPTRLDAASMMIEIADLDDNVAGSTCSTDGDCKGTNATCFDSICTGFCESNKNCGGGGTCVQAVPGVTGVCGKVCSTSADCESGQDCRDGLELEDIFSQISDAVRDAGLEVDGSIDVRNVPKTCGPSLGLVTLPDGVVGKACTGSAACAPGECVTDINIIERLPAGYCTGRCLQDSQCGTGGVCYKNPVLTAFDGAGRCLLGCTTSASCRSNQVCRTSFGIDGNSKSWCLAPPPDAGTPQTANDAGVANDI